MYLAAGTVYGLEGQLSELEDAARCIHSGTEETELADLEDQVATAAAQVHQAELQVRTLPPEDTCGAAEAHLLKSCLQVTVLLDPVVSNVFAQSTALRDARLH